MRYRLRTLLIAMAIAPPVLAGVWLMPFSTTSNCGGNSAALAYVSNYATTMALFAMKSPGQEFALASATPEQRTELAEIRMGWGVDKSDILISTLPLRLSDPRRGNVIVVCGRPFTNVPRYSFHRAPPTHAAAYADGSTALLTEKEFAALQLTSFLPASAIISPGP